MARSSSGTGRQSFKLARRVRFPHGSLEQAAAVRSLGRIFAKEARNPGDEEGNRSVAESWESRALVSSIPGFLASLAVLVFFLLFDSVSECAVECLFGQVVELERHATFRASCL